MILALFLQDAASSHAPTVKYSILRRTGLLI